MTSPAPPRRFLAPFIGITLLFAALGPPIGGATFVPLALFINAPASAGALAFSAAIASVFGHWIVLIAAYVVGLGPAATTGALYALWEAAAPERWPRALVAAVIGGAVAYAVALRLASLGASLDMLFEPDFDAPSVQSISLTSLEPTESASMSGGLVRAFVMSGAVAGLVSAMAASLLGLTMQSLRPDAEGAD